jgi:hypothetical protein
MTTKIRPSRRQFIGGLVAVTATLALAITAIGVAVADTRDTAANSTIASGPIDTNTTQDVFPAPVADNPSETLAPDFPDTQLPTDADPADTYEADPPEDALAILDFSVSNTSVLCNLEAPHDAPQHIAFTWNVVGAAHVFFGVDTDDAQAEPMFVDLPHSGNSHTEFPSGYEDYTYACPEPSHTFALTAVDDQGHAVSRTVTVVNNGDTY